MDAGAQVRGGGGQHAEERDADGDADLLGGGDQAGRQALLLVGDADWERNARTVVAQFRATCSANPDDEGFQQVLADLREASAEFAALWEERDIEDAGQIRKELDHPLVGLLSLESTALRVPARPDLTIVLHTPLDEANTAAKLEWLASPEGRRGAMYPVAG